MVDLLVSLQLLVDLVFDAAHIPNDGGLRLEHAHIRALSSSLASIASEQTSRSHNS